LESPLGIKSDTYLVLSFGSKSHLLDLKLSAMRTSWSRPIYRRAFVRLCESTLKLFRFDFCSDCLC
jgi:hypothetical protein